MKKHLLNKNHWENTNVHPEDFKNISMCGRKTEEWAITENTKEVTCRTCLKLINK
jgi:hypothetical protein